VYFVLPLDCCDDSVLNIILIFPQICFVYFFWVACCTICGCHLWNCYPPNLSTICLWLQGTPSNAHFIPMRAIFLPIILLQVSALSFAVWRFFDRLLTKLQDGIISQGHISVSLRVDELFMMIQYGSRFYILPSITLLVMCSNCVLTAWIVDGILSLLIFFAEQAPPLVVYRWR